MRSRVIPRILPVMKTFPKLALTCTILDLEDRAIELRRRSTQFSILEPVLVTREMDSKLLRPERYLLVATKAWKRRTLKDIISNERIIDLDPTGLMSFSYLRKFKLLDLAQTDRHFVNNTESLTELIVAGHGYGVLTEEFAKPYLSQGDLIALNGEKTYENLLALAWYPRTEPPAYFSAITKAIQ
jgi:LysR family transcriptional regulator (chromosome initiation inhibitor)